MHVSAITQSLYTCFLALIERFSFECRKVIAFAFTTLRDWLKRFAPLFHPIRSKTKTNGVIASRALRQLHVITSSFDWFTVLSVFFVIGSSNYFGFGFTTPNENRSIRLVKQIWLTR